MLRRSKAAGTLPGREGSGPRPRKAKTCPATYGGLDFSLRLS